MLVAYWSVESGWNTELEIRNNVAFRDLAITPVLRTSEGAEITLPEVSVAPNDVAVIDLRQTLAGVAPQLLDDPGAFGSVVLRYSSNDATNLFASTSVQRVASSIGFHFHEDLPDPSKTSGAIESIWWSPAPTATDYLLLTNASSNSIPAVIAVSDSSGQRYPFPVELGARQTQRLDVRTLIQSGRLQGKFGGITVTMDTAAGMVKAFHMIFDDATGASALLKTSSKDSAQPSSLHALRAPLIVLRSPDPVLSLPAGTNLVPQLFLRNTTSAELPVNIVIDAPTSTQRLTLPPLKLGSGETRALNVTDLAATAGFPPDAHWATVTVSYQGDSGDLVPVAVSYDSAMRYLMEAPFTEGVSHLWKGNGWHVDATHTSIIVAGNGGDQPTHASIVIFYDGGNGFYTIEQYLQPGQQIVADLGQIIANQIPDKDGKVIPPGATVGSYDLHDLDHLNVGSLYERKIIVDRTYGHGYYGCAQCCGYRYPTFNPNPFTSFVNDWTSDMLLAQDCTATQYDLTWYGYMWASSNTGVATVADATTNLVGPGSATGSAVVDLERTRPPCPIESMQPSAGITAKQMYQVEPIATASQGAAECAGQGQNGWVRNVTNQVQYSDGSAVMRSGLSVADEIDAPPSNAFGVPPAQTGSHTTTGDGSFPDTYYLCSTACPGSSGEVDALQTFTVNGIGLPHVDGIVYKCGSITIDGH